MASDFREMKLAEARFLRAYNSVVSSLSEKIINQLVTRRDVKTAVESAFREEQIEPQLLEAITDEAMEGVKIGRTTGLVRQPDTMKVYLLKTTYGKRKDPLIKTARAANFTGLVRNEITNQLTVNGNWQRITQSLTDTRLIKGDVAQHMRRLEDAARKAIADPKEQAKMLQLIRQSEAQIKRLAQNGAPTTQLRAAYNQVVEAARKGTEDQLKKAVDRAVHEKMRYNSQRIARTEMQWSYGQSRAEEMLDDPDVAAFRFTLDPRHPKEDVCDIYASADLFGLGPGVYPKDQGPRLPVHPNGLSTYVPVSFRKIKTEPDRDPKAVEKYLKKNPDVARSVMTKKDYMQFLAKPEKAEQLTRGWNGLDKFSRLLPE